MLMSQEIEAQQLAFGNSEVPILFLQILPGVTIGDNSVIGAGSVVTKNIPCNVVALGAPCRVVREIGEKDKKYYFKNRALDVWE